MLGSVESTHNKINAKIQSVRDALEIVSGIITKAPQEKKIVPKVMSIFDRTCVNLITDDLCRIDEDYNLATVTILTEYYTCDAGQIGGITKAYYRIIASENFSDRITGCVDRARNAVSLCHNALRLCALVSKFQSDIIVAQNHIDAADKIEIETMVIRVDYEICKCGKRMLTVPENSEMICGGCGRIKRLDGAAFKDTQVYPQEGQKTKHTDYHYIRHYNFWIERIQGIENKVFAEKDLDEIRKVIKRDRIMTRQLNVERMRKILKECKLSTKLNEHASLLVKTFGGPPAPQLTFRENQIAAIKFDKIMKLYEEVNPPGRNRSYYPFFIYKILESMFRNNPEKRRILNYIHLQTRSTMTKNDLCYERICALADAEDGLEATVIDPSARDIMY